MADHPDRMADGGTEPGTVGRWRGVWLATTGSVLGAVAAASCCVLPFALFSVGIGGVWIGTLASLAPYQPYFAALTFVCLAAGFFLAYRKPRIAESADGASCALPAAARYVKPALWLSTALVGVALAWPYIAPLLLEI